MMDELRKNGMMAHLIESLHRGDDIGHYGRLVFAMVARHFLSEDEVVDYLEKGSNFDREHAIAMVRDVESRDYSPPRREQILEWQGQQDFPICPNPADPDACNVYKDLQFPDEIYEHISQYREQKARAEDQ